MKKLFTPPLKKLNFWLILMLFTTALVLHSCKKELFPSAESPTAVLLEKAKIFYNKQTIILAKVSSANQDGSGNKTLNVGSENKKAPIWAEAKMEKTKDGKTVMTVPLEKYELGNKDIAYVRKYVFEERNGDFANGKIIEVIGDPDIITKEGETAIIKHKDKQIERFSGAVISYDLNYRHLEGHYYQEGRQIPGIVRITSKLPKTQRVGSGQGKLASANIPDKISYEIGDDGPTQTCTNWYLVIWYYDQYGDFMYSTEQYLGTTCSGPTGPVAPPPLGGGSIEVVVIDCAGVPNGTASDDNPCNTCIGGTTGITACPKEIKRDTSITNNAKINCLLEKLLGLDGTAGNPQIKALLNAFTAKGFDVTFKIGTLANNNANAETGADPNDPTKYNIVLNRNKINTESQMSWVKTLLHEAFHAYLLQKTYELFGHPEIALWLKKPEEMTIEELMDQRELKVQGKVQLGILHHEFMAEGFNTIKNGLKSFSLANNTNHDDLVDEHFEALSYDGLQGTSYYLNKVCKDLNGNTIMVNYSGGNYALSAVHANRAGFITVNTTIPCN